MRVRLFVMPLAAGLVLATAAWAHAFLDHAAPAVGATVPAPRQVSIWFSEQVEPAFSVIEVTDAAGHRVDAADTHIDPADAKLLHVSLKPVPPGRYEVRWRVVSVDTHHTKGDFGFTVAAKPAP
ncbi:MAG TPA: copper homeostasis periplasmic binding protein CopC [Stellaceae bacterium]